MNVEKIQSLIKAICMFDRNNDVARLQGGAIAAAASDKQFCVSIPTSSSNVLQTNNVVQIETIYHGIIPLEINSNQLVLYLLSRFYRKQ